MKVHAHLPPPLPTTLLPGRTSANQGAAATVSAKLDSLGVGSTGAAWQNVATTAIAAGGISGSTLQPLSTQRNATTTRSYSASGQGTAPASTPAAPQSAQTEIDPGDLPYVRGSIVDIRA